MNFTKKNQRKTAMLLHQLEESLGKYVIEQKPTIDNLPKITVENIKNRVTMESTELNIEELISATYIEEIFHFALEVSKDNSIHKYIKELQQMFKDYDIPTIRNVISHPNRIFLDEYWYKVATISSSKIIDIIGLHDVKEALISAESDKIIDPPDEWIEEVTKSLILNNLPHKFEHSITELIGRNNEEKDVLKSLQNQRISTTAIVAAGGIGKTALILDILGRLIYDSSATTWCDGIVFIDMKTEKLTMAGIHKLEAVETIEEVKKSITNEINEIFSDSNETLEGLYDKYKDKKLILFIDNLETLIRDSQSTFEDFHFSLPPLWRLLVTSRISITSAKIIPLENLKKGSAIALARKYAQSKGQISLQTSEIEYIIESCHNNPLAIKLTLDLYNSGQELPKSVSKSSSLVASFSYTSLIDKLSDTAVEILEALFLKPDIDRTDLNDILELSLDNISQAINELSNTSLIVRKSTNNTELFTLSSSIKELLLINPKNIKIRNKIQTKLGKRKDLLTEITHSQERSGIKKYDEFYIPNEVNDRLILGVKDLNKSFHGYKFIIENAPQLIKTFSGLMELCQNDYFYYRSLARLHRELGDTNEAISLLEKASEINENDLMNKYLLADILFRNKKDYPASEELYSILKNTKETYKDIKFATKILNGYFLSLLYQHKYEEVLNETDGWEDQTTNYIKDILGTYQASAWRRKLESLTFNTTEFIKTVNTSIDVFSRLFENRGYSKNACIQANKLIDEIENHIERSNVTDVDKIKWLQFIFKYNDEIIKIIPNEKNNELLKKMSLIKINKNPFINKNIITNFSTTIAYEDIPPEYKIISISTIPYKYKSVPNYLFAKDKDNNYIIHFSTLNGQLWNDWVKLEENMKLAIKIDSNSLNDSNIRALDTFIVA